MSYWTYKCTNNLPLRNAWLQPTHCCEIQNFLSPSACHSVCRWRTLRLLKFIYFFWGGEGVLRPRWLCEVRFTHCWSILIPQILKSEAFFHVFHDCCKSAPIFLCQRRFMGMWGTTHGSISSWWTRRTRCKQYWQRTRTGLRRDSNSQPQRALCLISDSACRKYHNLNCEIQRVRV